MMNYSVVQQSVRKGLLAKNAKAILPVGKFALDLPIPTDSLDELTPTDRVRMPWSNHTSSVSAKELTVQTRRHARLQVPE